MPKKLELGLPEGINLDEIDSDSSDGLDASDETNVDVTSDAAVVITKRLEEFQNVINESVSSGCRGGSERKGSGRAAQIVDERENEEAMQSRLKKNEELQKRAKAVMERSRQKRVKEMRKQLMHKIAEEFPNDEDRDVLRSHDVKFGPPVEEPEKRKKRSAAATEEKSESKESDGFQQEWRQVQQYLGVNAHLEGARHGPQSGLESKMEEAITAGNVEEAEKMSDRLASREFGQKIVEAIDAKRYLDEKQKEQLRPPKRKKLQWTFAEKQRWETKSNM